MANRRRIHRTNLEDVAREAGVHVSTAGAILNGGGGNSRASEETRLRVMQVAERLQYRPNRMAQNLRRQRSHTVGLVAGTVQNPFFAEMVTLVERFLVEAGYESLFAVDAGMYRDDRPLLETLLSRGVDGIIYWSEHESEGRTLVENGVDIPVAIFGQPVPTLDSVCVDWGLGARLAVEHLIERGRRRIGCLIPSEASLLSSGRWRIEGYREAMEAHHLEPRVFQYTASLGDLRGATAAAEEIGRSPDCPEAFFCFNDMVAISAMMGVRRAGRSVPGDVAIVGFDDIPLSQALDVPLSTMEMPMLALCRTAVELLRDRMGPNPPREPRHVQLLPRLIVRASS